MHSKVSASLTVELGYETSTSVTVMQENEVGVKTGAAAGAVTALYAEHHAIKVLRSDGTEASDNIGVGFEAGRRYAACQYPPRRPKSRGATWTSR
ncbi:hypothetical protein ACIPPS_11050 [Streptomyces sp. NPDC090127]|uniref:hypothetical protein n=1 Tax=Streptomyces sp. NPDC090127 TaxID=3365953 RepID=UPI00381D267A